MALLGIIVGGLSSILELLVAFGIDLSPDRQTAISAVAGLVLLAVGAWFHPTVPVGKTA